MALPAQRINYATNAGLEAAGSLATQRTNEATNPVPGNVNGWTTTSGYAKSYEASRAGRPAMVFTKSGASYWVVFGRRAGCAVDGANSVSPTAPGDVIPVTAGSTVFAQMDLGTDTANTDGRLIIRFYDAAYNALTSAETPVVPMQVNTWQTFALSAVAPAGATSYWVEFGVAMISGNTVGGEKAWGGRVYTGALPGVYFDGTMAVVGDFTYGWSGTAHASTSTEKAYAAVNMTGATGTGGLTNYYRSSQDGASTGTYCARIRWVRAALGGYPGFTYTESKTGAAGDVSSGRARIRSNVPHRVYLTYRYRNGSTIVGSVQSGPIDLIPGKWAELKVDGLAAETSYTNIQLYAFFDNAEAINVGDMMDFDTALIEYTPASGEWFSGAGGDPNYTDAWTGAANASTSTRNVYGLWVEQVAVSGAPRVQVTAIGLGAVSTTTKVVRECGGETWTVPGWKRRNTLGGDTVTDVAPPLNREVRYTLYVNGQAINSRTITPYSATGWIQSPTEPTRAMPVTLDGADPGMLALAKPSLKTVTYLGRGEDEVPLGGRYGIARAGNRGAASGLSYVLNAYQNQVSDQLLDLIASTPILLFRGLPSWGSTPALGYLLGDVVELPYNRDRGGQFTTWTVAGKLVAPVVLAPLTGNITNAMVAANLAGRTNASIAATSANKRNIDIAASPLELGT